MNKEVLLKYANLSQQNKKRCFALRDWCHIQNKDFRLQEAFDCLYEFVNGNFNKLSEVIDQLTSKTKVYGRSSVVFGDRDIQMRLERNENGKLEVKGYNENFRPNKSGQHLAHGREIVRKDGQMKKNVISSKEKLYDLGQEVRNLYNKSSNEEITAAMRAIKEFAKNHKISEKNVLNKLKSGVYRLDGSNGIDNVKIIMNNKVIKLNESQLNELSEATKLTEYKFYNNVQRFLSDLLKDPVGAKVPFLLQANNIARNYLLYHLKSQGIIKRFQKISDRDSQGKPKTAKMIIKYSVPKKDFAKKMKKLFIAMVAKNVPEKIESKIKNILSESTSDIVYHFNEYLNNNINECDGGGTMGGEAVGATSADASGQISQPLFGVQRRIMPNEIDETTATSNVGNYQYTVPFGGDKETRDRTPGFSVKRQDEDKIHRKEEIKYNANVVEQDFKDALKV